MRAAQPHVPHQLFEFQFTMGDFIVAITDDSDAEDFQAREHEQGTARQPHMWSHLLPQRPPVQEVVELKLHGLQGSGVVRSCDSSVRFGLSRSIHTTRQ